MKEKKEIEEKVADVKGTIIGFIEEDPAEKTQEQEIQDFKLKKQNERELSKLSEEEQKEKRKKYEEEEEKLENVKTELLKSIKERIPAIEKRFKLVIQQNKKEKVVEKFKSKTLENLQEKEKNLEKNQNRSEKER